MREEETITSPPAVGRKTINFDDKALVASSRKGDMQAYGSLIAKYQDRVFNAILRLMGNHVDAEELVQETFLRALEKLGQFRGHSSFYTWLFRIAINLTISRRRRGGRIRMHSLSGVDELAGSQADTLTAKMAHRREADPLALAMSAETVQLVQQALEELEDDFRLVIVLRDIEDMDYSQIAEILAVPVGTVKSRLHRARCALKDKLAPLVG